MKNEPLTKTRISGLGKLTLLFLAAFAISFFDARAGSAFELVGLPGSTWGTVTHDADGISGAGTMGFVNQGIDWTKLPGGVTLNTFAEYRWRLRSKNKDFYNTEGPALGVELRKSYFRLGVDYYWEHFTEINTTSENKEVYLAWYYDWDLGKFFASPYFMGLPGSTWGILTYDMNGINGSGALGYVNQGIDWVKLPGDVVFNTFVEYRLRAREKNTAFYDAEGPAVGIEFRKWFLRAGADYYWERFTGLHKDSNHMQYYISWYYSWDLLRLK